MSFSTGSEWSPADRRFLEHSELKITFLVIALLEKFSDNQARTVTRIGHATYRYGISQERSGRMVWSLRGNCRYGIPVPYRPTVRTAVPGNIIYNGTGTYTNTNNETYSHSSHRPLTDDSSCRNLRTCAAVVLRFRSSWSFIIPYVNNDTTRTFASESTADAVDREFHVADAVWVLLTGCSPFGS